LGLLDKREIYSPFEYPKAYEYWLKQHQAHWLHTEIALSSDINDWKSKLTETEKSVVAGVLKSFTQTELFIEDYWSVKVSRWFKKPEIQMMAHTFAAFESIHAKSYAYLNESLGLDDFAAFLQQPEAKAKIDRLINIKGKSKMDIAKSLAIFSAFNEGVNLFSSFAVLMSFSRRNLLKGVGQIIAFSVRDESMHSEAGCYIYRTFLSEYPEINTEELREEIIQAARDTIDLEDNFIDMCFQHGEIDGLSANDLKKFIRHRANTKLGDLGLPSNWRKLDKEAVERITSWFDVLTGGVEHQDFFAQRVTGYSKGHIDWSSMYNEDKK
jgi:ribonucleoside-diphosphate reductase beta chain